VLEKNEGYKLMVKISKILSGDQENFKGLPEDLKLNDLVYFKYATITSVDVEGPFSIYKNMLTNNRRTFKFDNIRKSLIVQSNITGKHVIILTFLKILNLFYIVGEEDKENEIDHTQ